MKSILVGAVFLIPSLALAEEPLPPDIYRADAVRTLDGMVEIEGAFTSDCPNDECIVSAHITHNGHPFSYPLYHGDGWISDTIVVPFSVTDVTIKVYDGNDPDLVDVETIIIAYKF